MDVFLRATMSLQYEHRSLFEHSSLDHTCFSVREMTSLLGLLKKDKTRSLSF